MSSIEQDTESFVIKTRSAVGHRLVIPSPPPIFERHNGVPLVYALSAGAIVGVGWLGFKAAQKLHWTDRVAPEGPTVSQNTR